MTTLLTIQDLVSGYAGSNVLHGVTLTVAERGVTAVLGRNGVGKSTLVNTIMGVVRPQSGSIRLAGRDLAGRSPHVIARAGVALVPQERRLFATLTVDEHLTLAARIGRRRRSDGWTRDQVLGLFPRLGERLRHRGNELSGGEQQMLAIARALLTRPRLLLLDEPSDGLAPAVVNQVGDAIRRMADSGVTIVMVEQNLRLAFSVAQRIAVMAKGRIVVDTTLEDFRSDAARARALLGV